MRIRKGFYAGSFNPFHLGHLDVYRQAEQIFDEVIIGVGENLNKRTVVADTIVQNIRQLGIAKQVIKYGNDLATALRRQPEPVALIRGIRDVEDQRSEAKLAAYLRSLVPGLTITYFYASAEAINISSSAIRELLEISSPESLALANRLTATGYNVNTGRNAGNSTPPPTEKSGSSIFGNNRKS